MQAHSSNQQEIRSQKKELRQFFRNKRNSLSESQQTNAAQSLQKQLAKSSLLLKAKTIAIYLSSDGEINTYPLIDYLWRHKKNVVLPIIDNRIRRRKNPKPQMQFCRYKNTDRLTFDKWKIPTPQTPGKVISPLQLDMILCPLVAFDANGYRLGRGGGFYDVYFSRYLTTKPSKNSNKSAIHKKRKPLIIGLAHNCQYHSGKLPIEENDIPLDAVITPSQIDLF